MEDQNIAVCSHELGGYKAAVYGITLIKSIGGKEQGKNERIDSHALRRFCMLIPSHRTYAGCFSFRRFVSGDPALALLTMDGISEPTAEELDALRHAMGLDQPVWIQYGRWLMNALHGDLGVSYLTQKPVLDEILRRFPITFHLAVWAIGWVMVTGIPAGIWAAEKKDTAGEIVLRAGALFFISVPSFFLAILCMLLFSEEWRLLPSGGYGSMIQMIMPSFVLAAGTSAAVMRLQQTSMTEVAGKEFITTERAKGLPMPFIMKRHVLPNALVPVITMLGTFFGAILGGSVIIEDMFSIPGLGSYVLAAIWGVTIPLSRGMSL
ncbi:MAG: ABC transporter permease [Dialister invisus]